MKIKIKIKIISPWGRGSNQINSCDSSNLTNDSVIIYVPTSGSLAPWGSIAICMPSSTRDYTHSQCGSRHQDHRRSQGQPAALLLFCPWLSCCCFACSSTSLSRPTAISQLLPSHYPSPSIRIPATCAPAASFTSMTFPTSSTLT